MQHNIFARASQQPFLFILSLFLRVYVFRAHLSFMRGYYIWQDQSYLTAWILSYLHLLARIP